jgi:hypothetical protein
LRKADRVLAQMVELGRSSPRRHVSSSPREGLPKPRIFLDPRRPCSGK